MVKSLRRTLSDLKSGNILFREAHQPVIILALRRGGSTALADTIASARGVWFSNEPYAVYPGHRGYQEKTARLPQAEHSQYFALTGTDLDRFAEYSRDLLAVKLRGLGTCRRTRFPLRADRVCLKVLNAVWMIDWFRTQTDAHIISLTRHPAAQALSVLRQGWDFAIEAYAARLPDLEPHFSDVQLDTIRTICQENNAWKMAILDWVVASHPLRRMGGDRIIRLTYEEVTRDPAHLVTSILGERLGFDDHEAMLATALNPSNSSSMSERGTNSAILQRDIEKLTEGWRQKIDTSMKLDGQRILDTFEIETYSFDP